MAQTNHYCPCCKSYSGRPLLVIEKAVDPEEERIRCMKCGWTGYRHDCIKENKP